MLVFNLIENDVSPVYSDQGPMEALAWSAQMQETRVPIVDRQNGRFLGTLHEEVLLNHAADESLPVHALEMSLMAYPEQHVFDVWHALNLSGQQAIPVADRDGQYQGVIRAAALRDAVEQSLGLLQDGLTLLVESDRRDADMPGILGVIDKEGVRVLSVGVEYPEEEETAIRISIRIEPANADRAVSALRRHGYAVHADARSYDDEEWADRADELLRYLDL